MPTRYLITLGAPTTAGGKVTAASGFQTVEGLPVALEGDNCWCPRCQSEGMIGLAGPRLGETSEGRDIALADDLCLCACQPPPRLIAAQSLMSQTIDGEQFAGAVAAAQHAVAALNAAPASPPADDKLPLVLIDPDTGEPFRNRPYRLELAGELIEGTLDGKGWTRPLSAAQRAAVLSWHVPKAGA